MKFIGRNSSKCIDYIKGETNNISIVSAVDESRILFIHKDENECKIICTQGKNSDGEPSFIDLVFTAPVKGESELMLTETRNITLPIHMPKHLIEGTVQFYTVPLIELNRQKQIKVTGFLETFMVGGRWQVQNDRGDWYNVRITRVTYNHHKVLVKFDNQVGDEHDVWFNTINDRDKIRPFANNKTTEEDREYLQGLGVEERLAEILHRSVDDL
jgi:hypothetical protein